MTSLLTLEDVARAEQFFVGDPQVVTGEMAALVTLALRELRLHMLDARARGDLPAHVAGQPSPGEILSVLTPESMPKEQADMVRQVVREVVHLRGALTRVQNTGTHERDLRMKAEAERAKIEKENNALRAAIVSVCEHGASAPNVDIIVRTPLTMPPIEDRSLVWREAETRISKAVDAGQDPDPADLEIVQREHLKHVGFDPDDK